MEFKEWLELDEARSRTFVAPKPKLKKSRPEPAVHHDLDSWLQHVDNLKKELELLKDKLKDKKKPDVTKKPEPKKAPTPFKPKKPEKEDDEDDESTDDERDQPDDSTEKDQGDRVLSPVADRRVDFGRRPVSKPPVPGNRSGGRKPDSKTPPRVPQRRPGGIHGN